MVEWTRFASASVSTTLNRLKSIVKKNQSQNRPTIFIWCQPWALTKQVGRFTNSASSFLILIAAFFYFHILAVKFTWWWPQQFLKHRSCRFPLTSIQIHQIPPNFAYLLLPIRRINYKAIVRYHYSSNTLQKNIAIIPCKRNLWLFSPAIFVTLMYIAPLPC